MIVWEIVLPPAISFYTFQEVAYIVDVYHRKLKPADRLVDYALFVSLFPHLIAGPIQRPSHLLPQVQAPRSWNSDKAFDGVLLILEGLFRKVVIADNCALIANAAFSGNFGEPNLIVLLLGTYAFAFQIYGDFSGYSCIARGS
jgi:D-alanyl-lipoteichoic acid acyltransferase DltB (MBOAT superfamily)